MLCINLLHNSLSLLFSLHTLVRMDGHYHLTMDQMISTGQISAILGACSSCGIHEAKAEQASKAASVWWLDHLATPLSAHRAWWQQEQHTWCWSTCLLSPIFVCIVQRLKFTYTPFSAHVRSVEQTTKIWSYQSSMCSFKLKTDHNLYQLSLKLFKPAHTLCRWL